MEDVEGKVMRTAKAFMQIDAPRVAADSGVPMSSNVVMVGALAGTGITGLDRAHFESAMKMNIRRDLAENIIAFSEGYRLASPQP